MTIVIDFGRSVQGYIKQFSRLNFPRPQVCPHCQKASRIIGHGFYLRKALDVSQVQLIWIKRWYCKACRCTISLLPSFLLRFRHYLLEVIQGVVVVRFEVQASWQQVLQRCTQQEAPSGRTVKRWCHSFGEQAARWWAAVQGVLARHDAGSPGLDPLGEAASNQTAPRALLQAAIHLLAWAKTQWVELADYGLNDRLRFLWQWGSEQGLGRLI
jgi:hypothetical protein